MWKKPWRWYDEKLVDCCNLLDSVQLKGITLPDLVDVARCNALSVETKYYSAGSIEEFRDDLKRVSKKHFGEHIILAYKRDVIGQTGDGHYSPFGGYDEKRDLVLILDVARFKYPPLWVSLELLWQAMKDIDVETSMTRGYIIHSKMNK